MTVCELCSEPASRSFTWNLGEGVSRTVYYCKNHTPKSKVGITNLNIDPKNS